MSNIATAGRLGLAAILCASTGASAAPASATPAERAYDRPRVIVALGDSLTSGHGMRREDAYPAILQRYLDTRGLPFSVVNAGVSGDTTADGLARLDRALRGEVDVLLIALGANDGLRGVPVSRVRAHLASIIEQAQRRGITPLLCAQEALPLHGWDYTLAFHRVFVDLARQYGVALVPFILADVVGRRDLLLPDFVHPNPAGARVIADVIWPYVREAADQRLQRRQAS